jgi:FkbM family methyltransferase
MTKVETLKRAFARTLLATFGRRPMVRLGRFLSNAGRFDFPAPMNLNGEFMVQSVVLDHLPGAGTVVFDVGANVGDWTVGILDLCKRRGIHDLAVHAFEPCTSTRLMLEERLSRHELGHLVTVVPLALSDRSTLRNMYVLGPGEGTNSLHFAVSSNAETKTMSLEPVETMTATEYCNNQGIDSIAFMKIDTEGHDMAVLQGATDLIKSKRICLLQFEYNHRWVHSRHFLKDVFDFAHPLRCHIAKITPFALEFYSFWHFELETFREANFVISTDVSRNWFQSIPWWNAPA